MAPGKLSVEMALEARGSVRKGLEARDVRPTRRPGDLGTIEHDRVGKWAVGD